MSFKNCLFLLLTVSVFHAYSQTDSSAPDKALASPTVSSLKTPKDSSPEASKVENSLNKPTDKTTKREESYSAQNRLNLTKRNRALAQGILVDTTALKRLQEKGRGSVKDLVIKGNNFVSEELIKSHIKLKAGETVTDSNLQKDIRQLFSLGLFEDIKITGQVDKKGKWTLIYTFKERVFISSLEFKGNKKLNSKDLKEEAFIEEHSFLNPHQLKKTIEHIKKQYREKGYHSVRVSHRLAEDSENQKAKKLIINITENKKLSIKQIQFIGNRNVSSKKLKAFIKLKERNLLSLLTSGGVYQKEFIDHDRQVIEYYYRNLGYLNVQAHAPVLSLTTDKKSLFLSFEISEGTRYKMGEYIIEEQDLEDKKESFKLPGKEFFSLGDLQQDLQLISEFYKNKGHALVKVEPLFYPDKLEEDKIHIAFKIDKGEIYKVGRIDIKGNKKLRDKVVFRRFQIKEGDIYNQDQINLTRQLLEQLAVFEKVNISTSLADSEKQEIKLEALIKERENTGEASLVGGYNSQTRLFIQGNLKKDNFLGLEQNIAFKVNLSYYNETMAFYYQNPYFLDTKWSFGFELFNTGEQSYVGSQFSNLGNLFSPSDYRTYFSLDTGFSVSVGSKLTAFSSLFLKYRFSKQRISEEAIDIIRKLPLFSSLFPNNKRNLLPSEKIDKSSLSKEYLTNLRFNDIYDFDSASGLKSSLSLTWEKDKRNDRFYAMRGFFTRFQAEHTGLGGHLKYSKLTADLRHYYNPLWKLVIKNRLDLGYVFSGMKNQELPFTELFLLGGPYNLRGFLINSQGPRKRSEQAYKWALDVNQNQTEPENKFKNPNTFALRPYGGSQKLFYSLELEIPLFERVGLRAAGFLDIGEANNGLSFDLNDQLRANVGLGIRWISPFGPLSLDWAVPYKPREEFEENSWQFQFSVGSVL